MFEGWDAAGKGGAIRRITAALDARDYQVIPIAAPTDEERAHHYLWRFWRHLPRAGRVTIFDRSWYGRVLVERVEGFATRARSGGAPTRRSTTSSTSSSSTASCWSSSGSTSPRTSSCAASRSGQRTPYKRWKLTDEDWRNREKWERLRAAVNDMVERTSTPGALDAGRGQRQALRPAEGPETVCDRLEHALA